MSRKQLCRIQLNTDMGPSSFPTLQISDKLIPPEIVWDATEQAFRDRAGRTLVQKRGGGELINRAFYLGNDYDWDIMIDSQNHLVLVPMLPKSIF